MSKDTVRILYPQYLGKNEIFLVKKNLRRFLRNIGKCDCFLRKIQKSKDTS